MKIGVVYKDVDGFVYDGGWRVNVLNGVGFMTLWDVKPTKRMIRKMKKCVNSRADIDISKKFCKNVMKFV